MFQGSNLLSALREEDRALLEPHLRELRFATGQTLYDPGQMVDSCYFPAGVAIGSYYVELDSGVSVETVLVGREGALGGIISQGNVPSSARCSVVHGGTFYCIANPELERAKEHSASIRHLFARYADCLMAQVFQSIACNAIHTIEQRAAKWLTAAVDRTGQTDITMTQEQLASMMGIGRSYASRVVQRFKRDNLVRTRRGGITVLDSAGLLRRACSCNEMVRAHFDTVLKGVYPD